MKKHIVTILIPALLCLLAAGCKQQAPDPLRDALGAYILQGREGTFRLLSIEKIDSTTFRTEFERRQNVFDLKLREETKLYESYVQQRKPRNAARHLGAIQRTNAAVKGLDSLRAALEGRLDEVAYYEYVFTGRVDTDNAYTEFSNHPLTRSDHPGRRTQGPAQGGRPGNPGLRADVRKGVRRRLIFAIFAEKTTSIMVKHIILWTLDPALTEEEKAAVKAGIKEGLEGLVGQVPGLVSVRVQTGGRLPSSTADLMLDSTLESAEALRGYAKHPAHVAVANTKVRPYTVQRACLDFEI